MSETTHELKSWPPFFRRVMSGAKKSELRRDDRGFAVGDTLLLREWDPGVRSYTGAWETREVTDVVREQQEFGLLDGFALLSIGPRIAGNDPTKGATR